MTTRERLGRGLDTLRAAGIATLTLGVVVGFGGQTWWTPLLLAGACIALLLSTVARWMNDGSAILLRSPLSVLGACTILLGIMQLAPWPTALVAHFSARAAFQDTATASGEATVPLPTRMVIAADRPAALRWIAAGTVAIVLFAGVAHYATRSERLRYVCGSVAAGFGICTVVGAIQLANDCEGSYGLWIPGNAPDWAPSLSDLQDGPSLVRIRSGLPMAKGNAPWPRRIVKPSFAIGPLASGAGAYIALAALALPLLVGFTLHRMTPRGSREPLRYRLRHQGGTTPLLLSIVLCALGGGYVGFLGGPALGMGIGSGVLLVGFLAFRSAGAGRPAVLFTGVVLASIAVGAISGDRLGRPEGVPRLARPRGWTATFSEWQTALRIVQRFPLLGVGLGSYGAVEPQFKLSDEASMTASSSLLQWVAETGIVGLVLLGLALAWVARRLPEAWRRVSPGDRSQAAALLGSLFSFSVISSMHTTIQYVAAALPAVAIAGTANRWLAGATDLFASGHTSI